MISIKSNPSVLQVCVDLDGGGIDRYLYNYCTRIKKIDFDFAAVDNKNGILEEPLRKLGFTIYKVPRITKGIRKNYNALKEIMSRKHYDAVHVHLGFYGLLALIAAKRAGVKTRIVHAHIAFVPESFKGRVVRKVLTYITKYFATNLAACGIDAAKWVWGEKTYEDGKVIVHNNAINTSLYKYNSDMRLSVRKDLGITDSTLLVGHVGRLCEQKNQKRLVEIFAEIVKQVPDSKLVLLGFREVGYDVDSVISKYGLQEKVMVLGVRNDIPHLLNAMDVFVFPSKYEGLPFTLIETQCNGLHAISASTVSAYVKVSSCVDFLPLQAANEEWAEKSISLSKLGHDPKAVDDVIAGGYDLDVEADKLKEYYLRMIRTNA